MHKCCRTNRRNECTRNSVEIRATLPDNKHRNHAKGSDNVLLLIMCTAWQGKAWHSRNDRVYCRNAENTLEKCCLCEWMEYVCFIWCCWQPPHQQYLHFHTGCCTHFQLYFPVPCCVLCACECVRLLCIPFDTHSIFGSWNIQSSLCVHTHTHSYAEPIDTPPTHFYGNSVSVPFNRTYVSLLINLTKQHKPPTDEAFWCKYPISSRPFAKFEWENKNFQMIWLALIRLGIGQVFS